tara:strand:- start:14387 stop:15148 length:762 start_codon:yes stop_codon:yes gene_type:complete
MLQDNLNPQTETILPYDMVTLPSQGIFYPNKKKSLKVSYLNASDENLLASQSLQGTGELVNSLLSKKILDKDIDVLDMPECDKEAILVFLRNTAFGTEYSVQLTDPITKEQFSTTIDLSILKTKDINVEIDVKNEFEFYLEKSKKKVKLTFLTPADTKELRELNETHKKDPINPYMTKQLEKMVKEIDGVRERMTISQFIQTMPITDSQSIRKIVKDNTPTLDLNTTVTSPSNEKMNVGISLGVEFFRPFYGV